MSNPRYVAFKALIKIEEEKAYSNLTLDSALKNAEMSPLDKAFASSVFYGVLEKKITLDYIISRFSKIKPKKIDLKTLVILRMALYQLAFMDKVPASAAVNEAVKICKKEKLYQSSGFVNALLRTIKYKSSPSILYIIASNSSKLITPFTTSDLIINGGIQ